MHIVSKSADANAFRETAGISTERFRLRLLSFEISSVVYGKDRYTHRVRIQRGSQVVLSRPWLA